MHFNVWQTAIETKFYKVCGILPVLEPGRNPYLDIKVISKVGIRRPYWFCYDIDDYAPFYWSSLLNNPHHKKEYDLNLTTALQLTEQLGFDVDPMQIPPLWVLSVEYIANLYK